MKSAGFWRRVGMRSNPPIRAVFFDLDDTLCDTIGTREARARRAFECLCRADSTLDFEALVTRALEPLAEPRSALGVRGVLAELGLLEREPGTAALEAVRDHHELLRLLDGVADTLEELSGVYDLGVITNWDSEDEQRRKIEHLGLHSIFRHFVVSASAGFEKPDPRIFAHALTLAGVEAGEAVFVGDRLEVDVAGAKAAGMRAVWFNHWGGSTDAASARPDAVIERFIDLPGVLAAMRSSPAI
jgi:FMN hydrolase / 5-amino-6-(5-phospho-D-ribitylamino)uracil phosphatase